MANQQSGDNGGRSIAIFITVGLIFVGLFFGGAQLLKLRNEEVAMNNTGQGQPAPSPEQEEPQPQEEERPTLPEPAAPAQPERPDDSGQASQPPAEEASPDQVASTGPSDPAPAAASTPDEALPATGPAEDFALLVGTVTLIIFGIYRLRQSKLAMMPQV